LVTIDELLDRYEAPARRGVLASPPALTGSATNARCGDVVTMFADIESGRLARVAFQGAGCTISQAAADVLAELAEGQPVAAIRAMHVQAVLDRLGPETVRTRLDCAGLGLLSLQRALGAGQA
jgi:nitrogen fixation NifU-like protein